MSSFQQLGELFEWCSKKYVEHLRSPEGSYQSDASCICLFGSSGVGKSSFAARLKSQKAPRDFFETVIAVKGGENVVECGVEVGKKSVSCTLFPMIHRVGAFQFCDMPGFKDNNPDREIVIRVLQKCFLSRISAPVYLVAFDTSYIVNDRALFTQRFTDYTAEFLRLFGANFKTRLQSVFFVLTKRDKFPHLSDNDIQDTLDNIEDELVDANIVLLVRRLSSARTSIDYTTETRQQIVDNVMALVKRSGTMQTRDDVDWLSATEDELVKRCVQELAVVKRSLADVELNMKSAAGRIASLQREIFAKSEVPGKSYKQALRDNAARRANSIDDASFLQGYNTAVTNAQLVVDRHQARLKQLELIDVPKLELEARTKSVERITYTVLHSKFCKYLTKKDRNEINVAFPTALFGSPVYYLAVAHDPQDTAMKHEFGPTLIPTNFSAVRTFSQASALYNSAVNGGANQRGPMAFTMNREGDITTIRASNEGTAFKLYIYHVIPAINSIESWLLNKRAALLTDCTEQLRASQNAVEELQRRRAKALHADPGANDPVNVRYEEKKRELQAFVEDIGAQQARETEEFSKFDHALVKINTEGSLPLLVAISERLAGLCARTDMPGHIAPTKATVDRLRSEHHATNVRLSDGWSELKAQAQSYLSGD